MPIKMHKLPPIAELQNRFFIDDHWRLWRRMIRGGKKLAAKQYGAKDYFIVPYKGKHYLAHRLIWAIHYGVEPTGLLDHINGKAWDNRIENLREVSHSQNRWNARPHLESDYRCVRKSRDGWLARVTVLKQVHVSPTFDSPELAELAGGEMARRLHGAYAYEMRASA